MTENIVQERFIVQVYMNKWLKCSYQSFINKGLPKNWDKLTKYQKAEKLFLFLSEEFPNFRYRIVREIYTQKVMKEYYPKKEDK